VAREGLAASAYVIVLLVTAVALVLLDRAASSDDSGPFTLLVLLTASAMLGFAAPRRAWLPGLVLGAVVALANLAYVTVGPARQHPIEPRGVGGAATLLVLVVPATLAAYAGAATGRRWRRSRP
jgi:peptidoglycan/LPS O-acetylase OafA/YrhL